MFHTTMKCICINVLQKSLIITQSLFSPLVINNILTCLICFPYFFLFSSTNGDGILFFNFLNISNIDWKLYITSIEYGLLKHFALLGHIFVWEVLNCFELKIYKDFELCQNCFQYFEIFLSKKSNKQKKFITNFLSQSVSILPYCILPTHTFTTTQ